jgi:hypothetical protein
MKQKVAGDHPKQTYREPRLDKRIIKGRPFGVGFDRSHLNLQQGAPS